MAKPPLSRDRLSTYSRHPPFWKSVNKDYKEYIISVQKLTIIPTLLLKTLANRKYRRIYHKELLRDSHLSRFDQ